jgi:hypothetical protein
MIPWLLGGSVPATGVTAAQTHRFWRMLTRCFASHLLVTAVLCGLTMAAIPLTPRHLSVYPGLLLIVFPVMVMLWWWNALGRAILARGFPSAARTMIVFFIPVIGLGTLMVALNLLVIQAMSAAG